MMDKSRWLQIAGILDEWYKEHARELPWRADASPYRVWISEIMLQQTRIEAVKPYYERFMKALPTVKDLAEAEDDHLMKLWEGLGYYSRARNLKKAALQIMEEYGGEMPASYEKLLKLPGIGNYTAGAIGSIAFGLPVPSVDGNVMRVVCRLSNDDSDISSMKFRKNMEKELMEFLGSEEGIVFDSGVFNQAIMEIGETICIPNGAPLCDSCPLQALCEGKKAGTAEQLPVKAAKKARKIVEKTVFLLEDEMGVLIGKRPENGLLAGLYEFPNVDQRLEGPKLCDYIKETYGVDGPITFSMEARHVFSHVEWHMKAYYAKGKKIKRGSENECIVPKSELQSKYPIPGAFQYFISCFEEGKRL